MYNTYTILMAQKNLPAILILSTVVISGIGISLLQSAQSPSRLSVSSVSSSVTSFSSDMIANSVASTISTVSSSSSNSTTNYTYKDGQYTSSITYTVPSRDTGVIKVQLTLANDIITNVSISQTANERSSDEYQSSFANSYQSYVIGKNINTISLSRIGGASLTTGGFQQALTVIRNDAKS